jgi:hypothetical protein
MNDNIQTDDLNYEVEQVPLIIEGNRTTPYFANIRKDTGECLGCVSEKYEVLQNAELIESVEALFKTEGFSNFTRRGVVTGGGARVRAIYDFKDHGFKVNGQDHTLRLMVQNSFDRSMRASFQVGVMRLVCTNGLRVPVASVGMTRKHTTTLEPEFVSNAFRRSVDGFSKAAPMFEALSQYRLSQTEGHLALKGLQSMKVLREKAVEAIGTIWDSPTYKEDATRNAFNLYNAVTQHLTHDVEGRRWEMAEKMNIGVISELTKRVKGGSMDELLSVGAELASRQDLN